MKNLLFIFIALFMISGVSAESLEVFYSNFDSILPTEFQSSTNMELSSVGPYSGLGDSGNQFSGNFLRDTQIIATAKLTLNALPEHTSIDINFLLAVIDSWDGGVADEKFIVKVDGVTVFQEYFDWDRRQTSNTIYNPPAGVDMMGISDIGFNQWKEQAFDMYKESAFDNIAHTADTLTIEWTDTLDGEPATNESWALDNLSIVLNGVQTVPEPASIILLILSLSTIAVFKRQ